ncbi:MAG: serine hydroxymethyltransferase [Thermoplasmata archaeon]
MKKSTTSTIRDPTSQCTTEMPRVLEFIRRHEKWRLEDCINLIASENVTSEAARRILASDFGHRYTLPLNTDIHGVFVENAYRGTRYIDRVESYGESIAQEIFECGFSSLKPLSGHLSSILLVLSCCRKGETIMPIRPEDGGYDGYAPEYIPRILGLECEYLPFDSATGNIDYDIAAERIRDVSPSLVVIGASFFLFPYDLKRLREACDDSGARLGYDASHVLGLIAGGEFQRPFKEGVDIVIGSTHKSFFGPQGGIFLTDEEDLFNEAKRNIKWRLVDNAHWNRIAALTLALEETREFGRAYASQCVRNALALARQLHENGIPVKHENEGFTRSCQVLLDGDRIQSELGLTMNDLAIMLEKSNIIIDAVGRMGVSEATRLGANEAHMRELASLISRCVSGEDVSGEVKTLRSSLSITFCF